MAMLGCDSCCTQEYWCYCPRPTITVTLSNFATDLNLPHLTVNGSYSLSLSPPIGVNTVPCEGAYSYTNEAYCDGGLYSPFTSLLISFGPFFAVGGRDCPGTQRPIGLVTGFSYSITGSAYDELATSVCNGVAVSGTAEQRDSDGFLNCKFNWRID
jgi:hypothetical protein